MGSVVSITSRRRRRHVPPPSPIALVDVDATLATVEAEMVATRDKVLRLDHRSQAYVDAFLYLVELRDTFNALTAIRERLVRPRHLKVVRG